MHTTKKLTVKRSNRVKKRVNLIPCEDNFGTIHNKTQKISFPNFYNLGKLWIDIVSKALVGDKVDIMRAETTREIQLKHDETKPQPKKKYQPIIVRYKDLSDDRRNIVKKSEEEDRKNFVVDNAMRLQNFLPPYISYCRNTLQKSTSAVRRYVLNEYERKEDGILKTREKIREALRDPDTLPYRYIGTATGGISGYLLGARGGIPRQVIFTSLGLVSAGVACFPNESGRVFQDFVYGAANASVYLYNTIADEEVQLRKVSIEKEVLSLNKKVVKCPIE